LPSTNTITGSEHPSGRSTYSNGFPTSSSGPIATHTGVSVSKSSGSKTVKIAMGAVFGALGLIVGVIYGIYYVRRQQRQHATRFHMLGDLEDDENPNMGRAIPVAGTVGHRAPLFGFVSRAAPAQRRDMLADEDTRVFNISNSTRREASGRSSSTSYIHVEKPVFSLQGSLASLRELLGGSVVTRGSRPQEPSGSTISSSWDEKAFGPFSDRAALVPPSELPASKHKNGRTNSSWTLPTNVDPFSDREIDEFRDGDSDAQSVVIMEAMLNELSQGYVEAKRPTAEAGFPPSTSTMESSLHQSSGPHSSESLDHKPQSAYSTVGSSSHSSDEIGSSPRTRRSSIIDANPPPTEPMRRSDSWWAKFAKTPFLDRRTSENVRTSRFVEFRDPNPPPRLVAIEESTSDSRAASQLSRRSMDRVFDQRMYSKIIHDRSVSSLHTTQTADSGALDRIGGMDIVQRDYRTGSSFSSADDNMDGGRGLSWITSGDTWEVTHEARSTCSGDEVSPEPDVEARPPAVTKSNVQHRLPSRRATYDPGAPSPISKRYLAGGMVAARVQAFEQRVAMEAETSSPPHESERSTKNREVVLGKKRERGSVKYGFAPRPSLFVANPDRKSPSGGS
jgi:hypothetical protein